NQRRDLSRPGEQMRVNIHRPAEAEIVILSNNAFGVQNSAHRPHPVALRACHPLRDPRHINREVESGARHIRVEIEFAAIVAFLARLTIEPYLQRTAVEPASIPHKIDSFGNGSFHFSDFERNGGFHSASWRAESEVPE